MKKPKLVKVGLTGQTRFRKTFADKYVLQVEAQFCDPRDQPGPDSIVLGWIDGNTEDIVVLQTMQATKKG